MKPRVSVALLLPSLWFFAACHVDVLVAPLAIRSAETKTPAAGQTDLARHATTSFREALYAARYESLHDVRRLPTAAYLENPSDPEVALLLGHAHLWTLSERSRVGDEVGPEITDHALLAEHYFGEASALAPEDDRIPGWQGGARLAIGDIHDDQRATRRGYFQLREAVRAYPAFNGFGAGFVLSSQDRDSDRFAEAVELFWTNLAACAGDDRIREDLDYRRVMSRFTTTGRLRVCWNTELVPHNFEGFFLAMGDVLSKAGDVANAERAYRAAMLSPDYDGWRFAPVLEARLANLDERVAAFAAAADPEEVPAMMFGSDYACTGCHAR